jgi:hypothetical protein
MAGNLACRARAHDLPVLVYLLQMVELEAFQRETVLVGANPGANRTK